MISEHECSNNKEILDLEELEENKKEISIKVVFEMIEEENIYEIFPMYDLQDEKLSRDVLEVYKILFWGASAVVSTLLWLYFLIT